MQQLTRIELHEQSLALIFNNPWFQEDISQLCSLLLSKLQPIEIKEHILGADRESYRLYWQEQDISLHFDVYSQSIWFESLNEAHTTLLKMLKQQLTAMINTTIEKA